MKILITTSGSGGHFVPALQLARKLKSQNHEVVFVGSFHHVSESLKQEFEIIDLKTKGIVGANIFSFVVNAVLMIKACFSAIFILRSIKPNMICGFGGFGSFPIVFVGSLLRFPTMIHEQNVVPGKANAVLSKFVKKIAISFKESSKFFNEDKTILTGCPSKINELNQSKEQIVNELGLDDNKKTLLILGGSLGSQKINSVLLSAIKKLEKIEDLQLIHLTGRGDFEQIQNRYERCSIKFAVYPFYEDMAKLYSIADCIVSRAGAVTITEIAYFHKKSILIPYPHAGGHQRENAKVLADAKLATIIEEVDLTAEKLADEIIRKLNEVGPDEAIIRLLDKISLPDSATRLTTEALALV